MHHSLAGHCESLVGADRFSGLLVVLPDKQFVGARGEVIDLPPKATVLDFAYHVHTDVGHRCRGAKVNGRIVPLEYQPQSGDRIEIMTGKTGAPKRDWLLAANGYLASARARDTTCNA